MTAIRSNRASIRAEWRQADDEYAVTFHDNPLPSFYKALEALAPHVCSLCDFPAKDAEKITPTGVTLREKGENTLGLITAKKKIKKAGRVFNIATPILAMWSDDENKGADHMEEDEAKAIDKFAKEAKRYIQGDRAQGKLAFEEETTPEPGAKGPDNTEPFPTMADSGT